MDCLPPLSLHPKSRRDLQRQLCFWCGLASGGVLCWSLILSPAAAQVTTDGSLSTTVNSGDGLNFTIENGSRSGSNLFHSFSQFSVPTTGSASFNNATDITNIFSRVTEGNVSMIDGLIQANGTANLFLLNPNGLIFGPNAQLNLGDSFIGSTATTITFADGSEFSTTATQPQPRLTISTPVGLQFGANPAPIVNRSNAPPLTPFFEPVGLQVQPNHTLALIGGEITLEGGHLDASSGRIELGSVGDNSLVSLTPINQGWALDYGAVTSFQDIRFTAGVPGDNASINTSGSNGNVQVRGQTVTLTDGAEIFNATTGAADGGSIDIIASESVELIGFGTVLFSQVGGFPAPPGVLPPPVTGRGGSITLDAPQVIVRDGAVVSSATTSLGQAGDVTINADLVDISGIGEIFIPFIPPSGQLVSFPSLVTVSTDGEGEGGTLTVNANQLQVRDGGRLEAVTFGSGSSGSLTVNASQSVLVSGTATSSDGRFFPSLVATSSGLEGAPPEFQPTGDASALTINTGQLTVQDGAEITVVSLGPGQAGTLNVNADTITLDQQGRLTAATEIRDGGNINLQVSGALLMRNGSLITAEAGRSGGGTGTGGNITIDAGVIVGFPIENSDIIANAFGGPGGNISITTQGLFGLVVRDQMTPFSDITASSEGDVDGIIQVNGLVVDPNAGLVKLPEQVQDPSQQIATGCASPTDNQFVVTGRGGLPLNPKERQPGQQVWGDVRDLSEFRRQNIAVRFADGQESREANKQKGALNSQPSALNPSLVQAVKSKSSDLPIAEANSWLMNEAGQIILVANVLAGGAENQSPHPATCVPNPKA